MRKRSKDKEMGEPAVLGTETLGARIKLARERIGLSQSDLSRYSGLSQQSISMLESGHTKRTMAGAKVAAVLQVRPAWLIDGVGPMVESARTRPGEEFPEDILNLARQLAAMDPAKLAAVKIIVGADDLTVGRAPAEPLLERRSSKGGKGGRAD